MTDYRQPAIVIFGPPASGKGTQGRALAQLPGFRHLSTGDLLRSRAQASTPEAESIRGRLDRGELVPDQEIITLLDEHLQGLRASEVLAPEDILILDGVPRTVNQARGLDHLVHVRKVLVLGCADEEALRERMQVRARLEGRSDDTSPASIARRLHDYREETEPVIDHYRDYSEEAIAEIDALGSPLDVLRDILQVLIPIYNNVQGRLVGARKGSWQSRCR